MIKKFMKFGLTALFALSPLLAYAEAELYIPPPAPPPVKTTAPVTINQGSNTGQASQNSGAGANNAAGAALIAAGTAMLPNPPTTAQGAALIAMGIIALMQGAHDSEAAAQSANTGAHSVINNAPTQKNIPNPEVGKSAFNNPTVKKANEALKDKGYNMTPAGLKKPDGSTVPLSAFSSSAALKAAGVDPNALKKAQDIAAKATDGYSVSSVGLNSGGGGGGGGAQDVGSGGDEDGANQNAFSQSADSKKAMVAGKTVNLDGDPIGVAGANIFDMIHDAYQKKRTGDQFVESEEAKRQPASSGAK